MSVHSASASLETTQRLDVILIGLRTCVVKISVDVNAEHTKNWEISRATYACSRLGATSHVIVRYVILGRILKCTQARRRMHTHARTKEYTAKYVIHRHKGLGEWTMFDENIHFITYC